MPISQAKKKEIVQDLHTKLSESKAIILTDHTGLNVKDVTALRGKLRGASVEYQVIKNTLARLAIKETGKEQIEEFLTGPSSLVFLGGDVVEGTKILIDFIREKDIPEIKIGLLDDRLYDRKELGTIARLPSRDVLLATIASGLISPLNGFAFIMKEMMNRFARAVEAVRAEKENSGD